jgi:dTDP-4-amino-4,6-dideoxygalactose transaminase
MPEATFGVSTRWLSCLTIDPDRSGLTREHLRHALAEEQIESRPVWKPLHLQPLFKDCKVFGGDVAAELFDRGLCLPSGSNLTEAERDRVIQAVQQPFQSASSQSVSTQPVPIQSIPIQPVPI